MTGETVTSEATGERATTPPLTRAAFTSATGTFPSGVTVVATSYRGHVLAKTVSAFTSLSLEPPLVSVAVGRDSPLVWAVRVAGVLGLSVLRYDQRALSDHFATPAGLRAHPPPALPAPVRPGGAPVLADCLSWIDCRLTSIVPGGDHALLICRAERVEVHGGAPLVHHEGTYRTLAGALPPRERSAS